VVGWRRQNLFFGSVAAVDNAGRQPRRCRRSARRGAASSSDMTTLLVRDAERATQPRSWPGWVGAEPGWLIADDSWRGVADERRYLEGDPQASTRRGVRGRGGQEIVGRLSVARDPHQRASASPTWADGGRLAPARGIGRARSQRA
jgi:hypothetical protein